MMEKAHNCLAPNCPTLFLSNYEEPFDQDTMSQHAMWLLSIKDTHVCALDMRHEFITSYNDFKACNKALFGVDTTFDEAVASFLGNTPPTWAKAYDTKAHQRPMEEVMRHYPTFKEWVRVEAKRAKAKRPRNPLED